MSDRSGPLEPPPETAWVLAWLAGDEGGPVDLGSLIGAVRRRQIERERPLAAGPAVLPKLAGPVGAGRALLAALAALLGGTAEAAGTPARPATWVLARRPDGTWRFAGTCGALPAGTGDWISEHVSEARFERRECGAWTLDVPADRLASA